MPVFDDFPEGLESASDYLGTRRSVSAELKGSVADVGKFAISAEYDTSLKEIICSLLAGLGIRLPNIQVCLSINLKALVEMLKGFGDALSNALKSALEKLDEALDRFLEHTKLDAVLDRISDVLSQIEDIASMINFCAFPINPVAIGKVLETTMGSFLGAGEDILNAIGRIAPDEIGGCYISGGTTNYPYSFRVASFRGGLLGDIANAFPLLFPGISLDDSNPLSRTFGSGSKIFVSGGFSSRRGETISQILGKIGYRISESNLDENNEFVLEATGSGIVNDIENLIAEENDPPTTYDRGGSDLSESPREVNEKVGVLYNSREEGIHGATTNANRIRALYQNLGNYAVTHNDGTEYDNIFELFLDEDLLRILRRIPDPSPEISEQVPVYNYCGEIIGYTKSVTQEQRDESVGEEPRISEEQQRQPGLDAGGRSTSPQATTIGSQTSTPTLFLPTLIESDIPDLDADKITSGIFDTSRLATGGSVGQVLKRTSSGMEWADDEVGTSGTDLSIADTDDLSEGSSNLYFTNERVDDRVNALLTAGSNITLTYDDAANTLTIASTGTGTDLSTADTDDLSEGSSNLYFTNERVDDRVNALLTAGTNITLTYDDTSGTLTINSTGGGSDDVNYYQQDDPPTTNISQGSTWFETDTGSYFVYVIDEGETNGQWVEITSTTSDSDNGGNDNSVNVTEDTIYSHARNIIQQGTGITIDSNNDTNRITISRNVLVASDIPDLDADKITSGEFDTTRLATGGTDGQVLTRTASGMAWEDAETGTDLSTADTDDLSEGSSNLYFTNTRADDRIASWARANSPSGEIPDSSIPASIARDSEIPSDTDDLSEGSSNLYFTNTRADDRIASWARANSPSGTIPDARIPNLDTTKITTGTFDSARLASGGTDGQVLTRTASGMDWEDATGGGGASVTLSDSAPGNPVDGELWIDTDSLKLFAYYNDGDSAQWVGIRSSLDVSFEAPVDLDANAAISLGDNPPSNPEDGELWIDTTNLELFVYYNDGDSSQWVGVKSPIEADFSLDVSDIPDLDADKITTGIFGTDRLATGGSVGQVLKRTSTGMEWADDEVGSPGSGEENVQSDWDETNTSSDAFIQNKPDIPDDSDIDGRIATWARANSPSGEIPDANIPASIARDSEIPSDTDSLTEGSTNLYFTNARADNRIATWARANSPSGTIPDSSIPASIARDSEIPSDTDALGEGSTNQYFTNERVDDRVNALLTAGTNITLTYDDTANTLTIASTGTDLSTADTDDLSEGGTNLYFTTARADARISTWARANSPSGTIPDARIPASIARDSEIPSDTDGLTEGSSNLYFTDTRADARISTWARANSPSGTIPDARIPNLDTAKITSGIFAAARLASGGTDGQVLTRTASGMDWEDVGNSSITLSDSPPANPDDGELWINTDSLKLFAYYNDGDSSQWVGIISGGGTSSSDISDNSITLSHLEHGTAGQFLAYGSGGAPERRTLIDSDIPASIARDSEVPSDTDGLSEGSTNQYFTNTRADNRIASWARANSPSGEIPDARIPASIARDSEIPSSTSDLSEGMNLYFTGERVDDRVNALLTQGTGITLTYDDAANTLTIARNALAASDIPNLGADKITSGTFSTTRLATGGTVGQVLKRTSTGMEWADDEVGSPGSGEENVQSDWDETSTTSDAFIQNKPDIPDNTDIDGRIASWARANSPSGTIPDANIPASIARDSEIPSDTDALSEGSSNLYFTNTRADNRIASWARANSPSGTIPDARIPASIARDSEIPSSTSTLAEGTNLYFTGERVDDRVNALLTQGTGITLTYNDSSNTLTIASSGIENLNSFDTDDLSEGSSNLYFTNARADNRIASWARSNSPSGTIPDARIPASIARDSEIPSDTDALSEGSTNQYFTNARADNRIATWARANSPSGTIPDARIPNLNTSKITSGIFDTTRLATGGSVGQVLKRTSSGMEWAMMKLVHLVVVKKMSSLTGMKQARHLMRIFKTNQLSLGIQMSMPAFLVGLESIRQVEQFQKHEFQPQLLVIQRFQVTQMG